MDEKEKYGFHGKPYFVITPKASSVSLSTGSHLGKYTMTLRLHHGYARHVAYRSVTLSASPSNSTISTRKHEKYTPSIVKRLVR